MVFLIPFHEHKMMNLMIRKKRIKNPQINIATTKQQIELLSYIAKAWEMLVCYFFCIITVITNVHQFSPSTFSLSKSPKLSLYKVCIVVIYVSVL